MPEKAALPAICRGGCGDYKTNSKFEARNPKPILCPAGLPPSLSTGCLTAKLQRTGRRAGKYRILMTKIQNINQQQSTRYELRDTNNEQQATNYSRRGRRLSAITLATAGALRENIYCLRLSFSVFKRLESENFLSAVFAIPADISFVFGKRFRMPA